MSGTPMERQLWNWVRELMQKAITLAYYAWWSYKTNIRSWAKTTAWTYVTLPTILLLLEVVAHSAPPVGILQVVTRFFAPISPRLIIVMMGLGVAFLVWHNVHEARKPRHESVLVHCLLHVLETDVDNAGEVRSVPAILQAVYGAFQRVGIAHVCVHTPQAGSLRIPPGHLYPEDQHLTFREGFGEREGVAGLVYNDGLPRYVPRLLLPVPRFVPLHLLKRLFLPHAVRFEWVREKEGRLHLGNEIIDLNAFQAPPTGTDLPFQSFLSVPLKASGARAANCLGVLNFDFLVPDPLDKEDIAQAVLIGLLLGEQLTLGA